MNDNTQKGAFEGSLVRNNKQIKADRAASIGKTAKVMFNRKLEDLSLEIDQMEQDRLNLLDMSPTNSMSLIVASDFKASEFADKDFDLSIKIRNAKIKLSVWQARYNYLFVGDVATDAPISQDEITEVEQVLTQEEN